MDNLGFILRRSETGGEPYETIASYITDPALQGAGNSSQTRQYRYDDYGVFNGITYWYQLLDVDMNGQETLQRTTSATAGTMDVERTGSDPAGLPADFELYQNCPNPFNPDTRIQLDIPEETAADLSVFDLLGRKVITLFAGKFEARSYMFHWNGSDDHGRIVTSGVYFCILSTPDYYAVRRMLLIR